MDQEVGVDPEAADHVVADLGVTVVPEAPIPGDIMVDIDDMVIMEDIMDEVIMEGDIMEDQLN